MKNQWYSDIKDIIKWGTIYHMVEESGHSAQIVYGAMVTPDEAKFRRRRINNEYQISQVVYGYFRDLQRLHGLQWPYQSTFHFMNEAFRQRDRGRWFDHLVALLDELGREKGSIILLLDPDNGIAPPGGANAKHVSEGELRRCF